MVCRGVTLHDDLHDRGLADITTTARLRSGIEGPMP